MQKRKDIIFAIFAVVVTILFLYWTGSDQPCINYFSTLEYHGVIKSKFLNDNMKKKETLRLDNDSMYILDNPKIYDLIDVGDYLYKEKGTTRHLLIHRGDSIYFYPISNWGKDLVQ